MWCRPNHQGFVWLKIAMRGQSNLYNIKSVCLEGKKLEMGFPRNKPLFDEFVCLLEKTST